MTTPLTATLYVDGTRFADTAADYDAARPVALSGVQVTWGRPNTLDQPDTATATMTVARRGGGSGAFPSGLTVGTPVRLTATGTTYGPPSQSTFLDPGFNTGAGGVQSDNAATARITGTNAYLRVAPTDAAAPSAVRLAPAGFSSSPNAWDAIPATAPGQRWSASVDVLAPAGARIAVAPVAWVDPSGTRYTVGESWVVTATGATQNVVIPDIWPLVTGLWIGLQVTVDLLPRWVDKAGTWAAATGTWDTYSASAIDNVQVLAPGAGTPRTVWVFSGRVTDLQTTFDDAYPGGGAAITEITAADFTADLENRPIGDVPWNVEALSTRVNRILSLAGGGVTARIDATVASTLVTYRDVDAQPARGLVTELAASVDAVAWSAVHQTTGPFYWIEDPSQRPSLLGLTMGPGGLVIISTADADEATPVDACYVPRDGVALARSVEDTSTVVSVTWQEQGTDTEGKPTTTERTVTVDDAAAQALYGLRRVSLSTQLQAQAAAEAVAARIFARTRTTLWRLAGVTWDTALVSHWDTTTTNAALDLLDGTTRIGRPVVLTNMPTWVSGGNVAAYLEGGAISFQDGRWLLPMELSKAGQGVGKSAKWDELNAAWRWIDFDPAIRWTDLYGVAATT